MSRLRSEPLKRFVPGAALGAALLAIAAVLSVTTAARGAAQRALAPAIDVTQTCSNRVQPGATIQIQARVSNTGDTLLHVNTIDGDAGTENTADDFIPTYQSGDTDGDGEIDPGENWIYAGSYTAPDEDVTNNVGVEAVAPGNIDVSDVAPCETDVVQQPAPGVIAGVQVVSGKVMVKEPGSNKFVELSGTTEIPIGSQVNTTNGTIRLISGLGGGQTNTAQFYAGIFTILQKRARNAFMRLRLGGGNFRVCRASGSARSLSAVGKSKRPVRRVWGSGKGRFTTQGRYSSATVRGTRWLTQDQCNGTLTRVLQGVVRVRDFRLRKELNVRAGNSYLARAPG